MSDSASRPSTLRAPKPRVTAAKPEVDRSPFDEGENLRQELELLGVRPPTPRPSANVEAAQPPRPHRSRYSSQQQSAPVLNATVGDLRKYCSTSSEEWSFTYAQLKPFFASLESLIGKLNDDLLLAMTSEHSSVEKQPSPDSSAPAVAHPGIPTDGASEDPNRWRIWGSQPMAHPRIPADGGSGDPNRWRIRGSQPMADPGIPADGGSGDPSRWRGL